MRKVIIIIIRGMLPALTGAHDVELYGDVNERNRRYYVCFERICTWLVTSLNIDVLEEGDILQIIGAMEVGLRQDTTIGISVVVSISDHPWPQYDMFSDIGGIETTEKLHGLSPGNISHNFKSRLNVHYSAPQVNYWMRVTADQAGYDKYIHLWIAIGTDHEFYDPDSGGSSRSRHVEVKTSQLQVLKIGANY